jgi:hypothetical protein
MEWISVKDRPIDFSNVSFLKTPEGVFPFSNTVSIFEHEQALWNILTATHWMPLPKPTKE